MTDDPVLVTPVQEGYVDIVDVCKGSASHEVGRVIMSCPVEGIGLAGTMFKMIGESLLT